jgi:hypothetical protein
MQFMMWKNIEEQGRLQMTIWRMRIDSGFLRLQTLEFIIIIFPLLQYLQENALASAFVQYRSFINSSSCVHTDREKLSIVICQSDPR